MYRSAKIIPVVEGKGDQLAVPELVRKILEQKQRYDISVVKGKQTHGKPNLVRSLPKYLHYAIIDGCDAILVVVDADHQCPRQVAEELAQQVVDLQLRVPVSIVCPKRCFETWFLGSLALGKGGGIRKVLSLRHDVFPPEDPEAFASPKRWLTRHMPGGSAYKETVHQAALARGIDVGLLYGNSRSFRRMCSAVDELVKGIDEQSAAVNPFHH
ncbi:MAG: DUF4276 family protein [Caldilineaceae bacterium]|nr:DUF4276 family protein [Caldilineaceae bacterium]